MAFICYYLITYIMVITGLLSACFCCERNKKRQNIGILIFVAATIINISIFFLRSRFPFFYYVNAAVLYLLPFFYICKGPFFAKAFIFISQYLFTHLIFLLASFSTELFFPYESNRYYIMVLILAFTLLSAYCFLHYKYARNICQRLFLYTKPGIWRIYTLIPLGSLLVVGYYYFTSGVVWHPRAFIFSTPFLTTLLLILICYTLLVNTIIGFNDRLLAMREIEIAKNTLESGRDYYEKLTILTENLHRLRHDQKFHLNAIQKLIETGENSQAYDYLRTLNEKSKGGTVHSYCKNRVIDALLESFYDRCKQENILFTPKISIPNEMPFDEYELCIILGNLLENAITACRLTPEGNKQYIKLTIKLQGNQFCIHVENSFNGNIKEGFDGLSSTKLYTGEEYITGLGISNIKAVIHRHHGEYIPEWNDQVFHAYVLMHSS